jgi:hypothetical protein
LNRALRDPNAELQEFASNALGSPESVLVRHTLDEGDDIWSETWLARTGRAGLSTPENPECRAVPSKHGLRFDQEQRMAPTWNKVGDQDK